ncbi:FG-GAP-like repeat-containing protein [Lysobacter sp. 2RAF19]
MSKDCRQASRRKVRALLFGIVLFAAWVPAQLFAAETTPLVTTYAGGGDNPGSGIDARQAKLDGVVDLAFGGGSLYIVETQVTQQRVVRVDANGMLWTFATRAQIGDELFFAVAAAADGTVYLSSNSRVWRVPPGGVPEVFAGNGDYTPIVEGPALATPFAGVTALAVDARGAVYAATGNRIYRIDPDRTVRRIAGTGSPTTTGDGGYALQAGMQVRALAVDPRGYVFFVDQQTVRRITPGGGIDHVTGTRYDNDPLAGDFRVDTPRGVAIDASGNLVVAGLFSAYLVDPRGVLKNFANSYTADGFPGDPGENVPALYANYGSIARIATDPAGNTYVLDDGNVRVRKITPVSAPGAFPPSARAFAPARQMRPSNLPMDAAIADVNGDGRNDVLIVSGWSGNQPVPPLDFCVLVYLQQSNRNFATPTCSRYPPSSNGSGSSIATTDLNKDGKQDAVVGTHRGLMVFLGNANGLAAGVEVVGPAGQGLHVQLAAMDFDRDGRTDIVARTAPVVSADDAGGLVVYYGNGTGGIARQRVLYATGVTLPFVVVDADRDGLPDIARLYRHFDAVAGTMEQGVEIDYSNGSDGFRSQPRFPASDAPQKLAAGDFDGDGRIDFATVGVSSYTAFLMRDASGGYVELPPVAAPRAPQYDRVYASDFDGDGDDDVLLSTDLVESASFAYRAQDAGVLAAPAHYAVPYDASSRYPVMAIGDVDGDGCNDIVTAGAQAGWALYRGIRCGPRTLTGTTPHFGARGADSPLPPHARSPALQAQQASPADNAVWRATQSFLKVAQRQFQLSVVTLRLAWRAFVSWF